MPHHVTITITDAEELALKDVTASIDEWAANALKNRARKAQEEILKRLYEHCNKDGLALAVGVEAQLAQALSLGIATTPEQRAAAAAAAEQEQNANLYGAK